MKIKNKKGFTLVELLIVVAIIAVLVAVAIPIFTSQLEKARQAVDLQNARAIQSALTNAYNTGEIDLGNCKHGEGVWVLICRDQSSKPSGYINWELTYNGTLFCGADVNTIIKGCTVTEASYKSEIEQILKEYGINVDSLKIKSSKDSNKKKEEKIKELQDFIARFSANASKSKQATSRKKTLEKIELDEIKPSNRKYPYVDFKPDREPGKEILQVKNISKTINGEKILDNISFTVKTGDKIAFLADNENAKTVLFQIIAGEMEPDEGELIWGTTITKSYFPKDNNYLFDVDENLTEWLRKYSKDPDETYVRGFLGRMLFSGDESLKQARVISGGEKVRCVLAKMMLSGANFLIFDEPTNHLDMESITSVNDGMSKFKGNILFTSHDHQLTQTVANRIIDIKADKVIDREVTYNEYLGIE